MKTFCKGAQAGFTFIEAVMVLLIIGILSTLGFGFIADNIKVFNIARDESVLFAELWTAVERVSRDTEGCNGLDVTVNSPTMVTLVNPDKAECANCADRSTTIVYRLNGTTLERKGGGFGVYYPLVRNVAVPAGESFIFDKSLQEKLTIQMTKTEGESSLTLKTVVRIKRDIAESVM
jgi:prepilin-type N-terminal cleavage/methylation domain-containing protein